MNGEAKEHIPWPAIQARMTLVIMEFSFWALLSRKGRYPLQRKLMRMEQCQQDHVGQSWEHSCVLDTQNPASL